MLSADHHRRIPELLPSVLSSDAMRLHCPQVAPQLQCCSAVRSILLASSSAITHALPRLLWRANPSQGILALSNACKHAQMQPHSAFECRHPARWSLEAHEEPAAVWQGCLQHGYHQRQPSPLTSQVLQHQRIAYACNRAGGICELPAGHCAGIACA